jgi:hypothetical protein
VNQIADEPDLQSNVRNLYRLFPQSKDRSPEPQNLDLDTLASLIPPKDICDKAVDFYCSNFESVLRILHLPTFLSEYQQFWNLDAAQPRSESFTAHLALVNVISSSVCCPQSSVTDTASSRLGAHKTCSLVEAWLSKVGSPQTAQTSAIQTSCLLILANQILCISPDQIWQLTCNLVRSALSAGLHRDPEEFTGSNVSAVQNEILQRLWFTVMELDVQVSTSCGLPSLTKAIEYTCKLPLQITDLSLSSGTERPAAPEFVSAAIVHTELQIVLTRSLPLRFESSYTLTSIKPNIDAIDELLRQLEEQRLLLYSLSGVRHDSNPETLLRWILGDMCFRKPMISLYILQLQRMTENNDHRTHDTARKSIDTMMGVMSHSDSLDPGLTSHGTIVDWRQWSVFQDFHRDDLIRAANGACLAMKVLASNPPANTTLGVSQSNATSMT